MDLPCTSLKSPERFRRIEFIFARYVKGRYRTRRMQRTQDASSAFDDWCTSEDAATFPWDPPITQKGFEQTQSLALDLEQKHPDFKAESRRKKMRYGTVKGGSRLRHETRPEMMPT